MAWWCWRPGSEALIWVQNNVELFHVLAQLLQFCRYDVFMVTESGIRATNVKPVGKREVVINMKGIHPNTRDDGVINYLEKYGKVGTNKVVY